MVLKEGFESSPVALWEEDFSRVKQRLEVLRAEGHTDLAAYIDAHPELVGECAALIRVIDVNRVPRFVPPGITVPDAGQIRPAVLFKETDFWAHGITAGFEYRW